jgi:hypothetical protein
LGVRPVVIALAGLPGSGKTTVGRCLEQSLGAYVLSRDSIKRALFGKHDFGDKKNELAFDVLMSALPLTLENWNLVVVDGMTFRRFGDMEHLEDSLFNMANLLICHIKVSPELAAARLSVSDPDGPGNRNASLVNTVATSFRTIPPHWIEFDGGKPVSVVVEAISDELILRRWMPR